MIHVKTFCTIASLLLFTASQARAEMPAVELHERKLAVSLGTLAQNYSFELGGGNAVTFEPNLASYLSLGVAYSGIIGLSYKTKSGSSDLLQQKGSTTYDDFRVNLPNRRFNVFLFYSRFKGFYVSNSHDFDPNLPTSAPYFLYPALYAQNMGANFTWVWNSERFSLAALMDMSERQVKSGGSWLIGGALTETIFRNDGPIIPSPAQPSYGDDAGMTEGRVRAFHLKVGYGYTDVFRNKWFLSGLASVGVGPQEVSISTPAHDDRHRRFRYSLYEVLLAGGYNGDRFFSGVNIYTTAATYKADQAEIVTKLTTGNIYLGTRF